MGGCGCCTTAPWLASHAVAAEPAMRLQDHSCVLTPLPCICRGGELPVNPIASRYWMGEPPEGGQQLWYAALVHMTKVASLSQVYASLPLLQWCT